MKIPTKLMIGKNEYTIAVTDILRDNIAGGCHETPRLILISSDQSSEEAAATLWHEILHAIEAECKITLGHRKINKMEYILSDIFEQLTARKKK